MQSCLSSEYHSIYLSSLRRFTKPYKARISREEVIRWLQWLLQQMKVHERYLESTGTNMEKAITSYLKVVSDKESLPVDSSPESQLRTMFIIRTEAAELLSDLENGSQVLVRGEQRNFLDYLGSKDGLHLSEALESISGSHLSDGAGPSQIGSKKHS